MAMWDVDLTTRAGARSAVQMGSVGAFVFAGMGVLGAVLVGGVLAKDSVPAIGTMIGGGLEAAIGLVAGFRMRAGKGLVWASVTAVLLCLEMLLKLVTLSIGGMIISGVVMIYLVNGIRGLRALATRGDFTDDDMDVFS